MKRCQFYFVVLVVLLNLAGCKKKEPTEAPTNVLSKFLGEWNLHYAIGYRAISYLGEKMGAGRSVVTIKQLDSNAIAFNFDVPGTGGRIENSAFSLRYDPEKLKYLLGAYTNNPPLTLFANLNGVRYAHSHDLNFANLPLDYSKKEGFTGGFLEKKDGSMITKVTIEFNKDGHIWNIPLPFLVKKSFRESSKDDFLSAIEKFRKAPEIFTHLTFLTAMESGYRLEFEKPHKAEGRAND